MSTRGKASSGESTPRVKGMSSNIREAKGPTTRRTKLENLSLEEDDPGDVNVHHPEEEHHVMTPSERGKKGISHGMSPHDRGVLGAQARWAKAHAAQEAHKDVPEKGKGG